MENQDIFDLLKNNCINVNFSRNNSGKGRTQTLGLIYNKNNRLHKKTPLITLSSFSKKRPQLYEKMFEFGKKICNKPFTSIQVNHNYVCKRHRDSRNVGESTIIGIGDYVGGDLVIEYDDGIKTVDIRNKLYTFNGSKYYHWVTPITSGDRYSLIFFHSSKYGLVNK